MKADKTNDKLRSLGALIKTASTRYSNEFVWQDITLTDEFQRCYTSYLERSRYEIEFFTSTSVITTLQSRYIFVPNQWFVIASYVVDIYEELYRYKELFAAISDWRGKKLDEYTKQLRDATTAEEKKLFSNAAEPVLIKKKFDETVIPDTIEKLWRFVTDYSWWSGQKTIDRHDFHMSVILNMLNLVNASQGYVADIVSAYANDKELRYLVRSTDGFTVNLTRPEGYTPHEYIVDTSEEFSSKHSTHEENTASMDISGKPRIKISSDKVKEIKVKN